MWIALAALLLQCADYSAEGAKALDAREYENAVQLFSKAVAEDPQDYNARFQLALAYSLQGKTADAIPHYRAVLELKPQLYEAEINLGMSLVDMKDSAGAIPPLEDAVRQKPQEFQPSYYLGRALLDQKRWKEAEAALTTASAADPKSAGAEAGLGQAIAQQGRPADAEPHYRKAVTLDPAYRDFLLELAGLYETNKQPDKAIAIYREFPQNAVAGERIAALLLNSNRTAEAIPGLEAAVAKSPTTANRIALAQAYLETKQVEKATALAAMLAAGQPMDFRIRMFYGRLLRDQRHFPDAAAQFGAAAKLMPNDLEPWNELVAVLITAEQYPQALAALDRVKALGGETPAHSFSRGLALDHLHQRKEAIENYNKFLETNQGKSPNEEFQARQRVRILERELGKK